MTLLATSRDNNSYSQLVTPLLMLASAVGGGAVVWGWQQRMKNKTTKDDDGETDYMVGHKLVWNSINGAMNAAMMYTGDKLQLYSKLNQLCNGDDDGDDNSGNSSRSTTAIELAKETGYNQRWLREWLAHQAAMGVLILLPPENNNDNNNNDDDDDASLKYRLPKAIGEVLGNPNSKEYDISMIQMVPSLVNRAKTMLPEAFQTGIGRPYDDSDISNAIDRHHSTYIRDVFIPYVLPKAKNGSIIKQLKEGCIVADLGCGAGNLLISLAKQFPNSTFHGYEISKVALENATYNISSERITNIQLHDANEVNEQLGNHKGIYDLILIYDVLHDSTNPNDLVKQVKLALKPTKNSTFICGDIPCQPSIRQNILKIPNSSTLYGFSTCLCMSCSLSTKDGAGLGTLGFSIPIAKQMMKDNGFNSCDVLDEGKFIRWFLIQ